MGESARVPGARRVRRIRLIAVAVIVGGLLIGGGVLARAWIDATPYQVAEGAPPLVLESPDGTATVNVPEGWVVHRDGDASAVVSTPDRALTARVALVDWAAEETLASHFEADVVIQREELESGFVLDHADGIGAEDVLAVVRRSDDSVAGRVVVVTAEIAAGRDPDLYRPALASLLEAISP